MRASQVRALREAAQALITRLDEIDANANMRGIYQLAATHGMYYTGPTYGKELQALRDILSAIERTQ